MTDLDELIAEARKCAPGDDATELAVIVHRLADALEAVTRQPSEDDREVLAKQLRDIGAVRKVDQDCSCQDCEGAAEWVNAPLSVVLDHFKTNVSDAEPTHLVCAWCPQPARGDAWHNDGKLHPSCGQIDHGQGWVPPYTPPLAVPDAATELRPLPENGCDKQAHDTMNRNINRVFKNNMSLVNALEAMKAERDAALAAIERVRAVHRKFTYYELEDSCPDTSEDHREERHHESDEIGEFYCEDMPTGDVVCDLCRDADGERMDWPCPTAVALGLNEGESDD